MKTNDSENSGRSSPQLKTNTKNSFFQGKIHKTEGSNRLLTETEFLSNPALKNRIPIDNKNPRNDAYKVYNLKNKYSFKIIQQI